MKKRACMILPMVFTFFSMLSQSFITSTFYDSVEDWFVDGVALYYQRQNGQV